MIDALLASNADSCGSRGVARGRGRGARAPGPACCTSGSRPRRARDRAAGPQTGDAAPAAARAALVRARSLQIGGADESRPPHAAASSLADLPDVQDGCCRRCARSRREESDAVVLRERRGSREHAAFAAEHGLDPASYVLSRELGLRFEVATAPYAVLIDAAGIVAAKGPRQHARARREPVRGRRLGVADDPGQPRRPYGAPGS
jgi:hypothetical protein